MCSGCADVDRQSADARRTDPVELDQQGSIFELALGLSAQRSPDARAREMAALATGALLGPVIEGGVTKLVSNGTEVRATCGATLISPSYVVTAAHCTDTSLLDVPVGVEELEALGVRVSGFERVVVDPGRGYLSDCFGS